MSVGSKQSLESTVGVLINYNNLKTNLGQFGGELLSVHSIFSLFFLLGMSGSNTFFCDPFIAKSSVKTTEPHYLRKVVKLTNSLIVFKHKCLFCLL